MLQRSKCMYSNTKLWSYCKFPVLLCRRSLTHFQVLGVEENVNTDAIKRAFREKAKELHPDRARDSNMSLQEAHQKFVELRAAYEALVDPRARGLYVKELHMQRSRPAPSSSSHTQQTRHHPNQQHYQYYQNQYGQYGYEDGYDEEFPEIRFRRKRRNGMSGMGKKAANMILHDITSWEAFELELENAITTAIYGPGFIPTKEKKYPDDLETEELKSIEQMKADNVIMHVVNGRQLLGKVLLNPTPYERLGTSEQNDSSFVPREQDFLELMWGQSVTARATLKRHDVRPESIVLDFDLIDEAHPEGKCNHAARMVEIDRNMFGRSQEAILNLQGKETHRIIRTYFPGVQNIFIYNAVHRYIEYKCSRAWMPKSSLWMFEPRDASFDAGGWYIQRNEDTKFSRFKKREMDKHGMTEEEFIKEKMHFEASASSDIQASVHEKKELDPAICILICGFSSLDRIRNTNLFTKW